MGCIKLKAQVNTVTSVSNTFIDEYMTDANDAQIKIYLYLLRCIGSNMPVSVSDFADRYNLLEKDVLRCLMYWGKKGLLTIEYDREGAVVGICVNEINTGSADSEAYIYSNTETDTVPSNAVPAKKPTVVKGHAFNDSDVKSFCNNDDIRSLIFATESFIGRTLSSSDIQTLMYIHETLQFPADLIEFLIDHCVSHDHKSMKYIEKTALGWHEDGINTLKQAREHISGDGLRKQCYSIFKALGIRNRDLTETDLQYANRWINEYKFSMDMILEACRRTISAISSPSMQYTETILRHWKDSGVCDAKALEALDASYRSAKNASRSVQMSAVSKKRNYTERTDDFNAIARTLMENQQPLSANN